MIQKIKDASNAEHLVQGAGYVYDEAKNSVAFGDGTSATGQDQFVFGRTNNTDPNKAEIAGGGATYNQKYTRNYFLLSLNGQNIGHGGFMFAGNTYSAREETMASFLTTVCHMSSANVTAMYSDVTERLGGTPNGIYVEKANGQYKLMFRGYDSPKERIVIVWVSSNQATKPTVPSTYLLLEEDNTPSESTSAGKYNQKELKTQWGLDPQYISWSGSPDVIKNLRTLDWNGNQWNAGDITCDDGNGNTISLRALAAAVAALQS